MSAPALADTGVAVALPGGSATDATTATSASAQQYGAAEAKDAASALLMARLRNRKIELLSVRTTDSTTYALADGSMQTGAYAGPVRVKQDVGDWKDIDTGLSDVGADLDPQVAADIAVSDGGDTDLASVAKGGKPFGLGWEDKLPTPTVKDATASYDLGDGQSLSATALAQGFSENITLDSRPTPPSAIGATHGWTASASSSAVPRSARALWTSLCLSAVIVTLRMLIRRVTPLCRWDGRPTAKRLQ